MPLWFYLICLVVSGILFTAVLTGIIVDPILSVLFFIIAIPMLGSLLIIIFAYIHDRRLRKNAIEKALKAQFEAEQKKKGLVKFSSRNGSERWGTEDQVFEWQQSDEGLVKYKGAWVTLLERDNMQRAEREKSLTEQRLKTASLILHSEKVSGIFGPVQHNNSKGVLVLTNKQALVVQTRGTIRKSYKLLVSVKLADLTRMKKIPATRNGHIALGNIKVSSSNIEGLTEFHNSRIFPEVQKFIGLVEYKGEWMSPAKKSESIQLDKGLVKHKGKWMTSQKKFERQQLGKGLVKYKGKWMTPEEKHEKNMLTKGLVKFEGKWTTPEEKLRREHERFENEQRAKGLQKFKGRWGTPSQVIRWKKLYTGLASDFMDRSPRQFEEFVSELFEIMGYSTSLTTLSKDFGADVIAKKDNDTIVIQVKRFRPDNKVGVKEINQVLGSMHPYNANRAIVVTTSDFTSDARKLARRAPVELWNRAKLYEQIESHFFGESSEQSIITEISSHRRDALGWFRRALILTQLGRHDDAIEAYKWGLELIRDLKGSQWEQFKKIAPQAIAEIWNNKGVALEKLGKLDEAIECFDKALEINTELKSAQTNKARVKEKLRNEQTNS